MLPAMARPPDVPRLAISLPIFAATDPGSWQHLLDLAQAADRAGIDRVLVSDHVVFGENLDAYGRPELGGTAGGRQPTGPDGPWLEPLTVLSVVCGLTSRVRLMTHVLQAALRRPAVLAKAAATLDVLSDGRLDLGVGVGWQREEYEAAGLDFENRGTTLDHSLAVCQTLWQDSPAFYDGEGLRFGPIHCMPQPRQPGGVPVWVSGTLNRRVMDRLARFGAGWIPWGPVAADPAGAMGSVRQALSAAGRDPDGVRVLARLRVARDDDGTPDLARTMQAVPGLVEAGVADLHVALPVPDGLDAAAEYLAEVAGRFRQAAGRTDVPAAGR
jgi:probable F420-dependent oxidoreductase